GQEGALQLEAGRGMGALSELLQAMGLRDAAALESIGASQQGQEQRSLDLAYQDFLEQRDFPRQNINWMSEIIRGLPQERTIQQSQTGPAQIYQPSTLSQLSSAAAAAAGIWDLSKGRKDARGGLVREYSKGGALRYAYSYEVSGRGARYRGRRGPWRSSELFRVCLNNDSRGRGSREGNPEQLFENPGVRRAPEIRDHPW